MSLLPETDRILLGPGPSQTSPRVMRAMAAPDGQPPRSAMLALLDDVRSRLTDRSARADGSFAFAVSGTGTSGMETAVANLVATARGARRGDRLFRRSPGADVRALRARRAAGWTWSGAGVRPRSLRRS
jgi:hypothetical protein